MLRVGHIPYLVFEPFFSHLSGFELVRLNPRMLGRAMARGVLDAGPLSLVDFLRLEAALTPLPFGVATRGEMSTPWKSSLLSGWATTSMVLLFTSLRGSPTSTRCQNS